MYEPGQSENQRHQLVMILTTPPSPTRRRIALKNLAEGPVPKDSLSAVRNQIHQKASEVPNSLLLHVAVLANRVSLVLLGFSAPQGLQKGARVDKNGHQLVAFHHTHISV